LTRVEFHPEAAAELTAAARYYEGEATGLGSDFLNLIEVACDRLAEFPDSGRLFGSNLRRLVLPRFPYALIYRSEDAALTIVAVANMFHAPAIGAIKPEGAA
jgi:plasmid stabilization system protein ParE